jgi:hypothetical protein
LNEKFIFCFLSSFLFLWSPLKAQSDTQLPPTVDEPIYFSKEPPVSSKGSSERLVSPMQSAEVIELRIKKAAQEVAENITHGTEVKTKVSIGSVDVISRAIASGSAFAYVLISEGNPVPASMALGATAAALSAGFQVYAPLYKDYLTKRGLFKIDRTQLASFPESFFKEYLMQWLYLGIYHVVAVAVGVENHNLFSTVFWSWVTEGTWSVIIGSYAMRLEKKLGAASKAPELFYRSAFLLQCFLSSLLVTYSFHDSHIAQYVYWAAGGLGAGIFGVYYIQWREILYRLRNIRTWDWRGIQQALRQRVAFEWKAIAEPTRGLRQNCRQALKWLVPFMRPSR